MPLRPGKIKRLTGIGPALHFLLGNVMVLNSRLDEMWFGWRVGRLFSSSEHLLRYCAGGESVFFPVDACREQGVRYWISGVVDTGAASLSLYDAGSDAFHHCRLYWGCGDYLVGFRKDFIGWLSGIGIAWLQQERNLALWKESCDEDSLAAIGDALVELYQFSAFGGTGSLDLKPFVKAVDRAPDAFMSHDLLGWAHYRNGEYESAAEAFNASLAINPNGAGVLSGLMWCAIMVKNRAGAVSWALKKAMVCGKDQAAAEGRALRLYGKYHS